MRAALAGGQLWSDDEEGAGIASGSDAEGSESGDSDDDPMANGGPAADDSRDSEALEGASFSSDSDSDAASDGEGGSDSEQSSDEEEILTAIEKKAAALNKKRCALCCGTCRRPWTTKSDALVGMHARTAKTDAEAEAGMW